MIEVYKKVDGELIKKNFADIHYEDIWIHIIAPKKEEIEQISKKFSIPQDFIEDSIDVDENPRLEREDNATLILIQTPYYDKDDEYVNYKTIPLGIILIDNGIITVSPKRDDVIKDFLEGRIKKFSTKKKKRLILQILSKTSSSYLRFLQMINKHTNKIEYRLEKSMKNEELMDFLDLQKSLVYFTTSLRSNEAVMERLMRLKLLTEFEADKDIFEDLIIDNKQAIEMTEVHTNILKSTMDAFASMISNNLNSVMKFLTSITLILMIPTLVASIYGMNIKLPFAKSPKAFILTMGFSVLLSLIGIYVFKKRKWF